MVFPPLSSPCGDDDAAETLFSLLAVFKNCLSVLYVSYRLAYQPAQRRNSGVWPKTADRSLETQEGRAAVRAWSRSRCMITGRNCPLAQVPWLINIPPLSEALGTVQTTIQGLLLGMRRGRRGAGGPRRWSTQMFSHDGNSISFEEPDLLPQLNMSVRFLFPEFSPTSA